MTDINTAAKTYQMSAGQYPLPIVFRAPNGAAENLAAQHSTSVESLYAHFPGLKVVTYATADDAYGLLKTAIRDNNPTIFLESELTYGQKGEVPDEEYTIPFGKARVRTSGSDLTIITWGKQVFACERGPTRSQGHSVELIDLRSLRPLDHTPSSTRWLRLDDAWSLTRSFVCWSGCRNRRTCSTSLFQPALSSGAQSDQSRCPTATLLCSSKL